MKFLPFLLYPNRPGQGYHPIIFNQNIPSCRNCIHYQPSFTNTEYTSNLNKCLKFGTKNIQTDIITYDYADFCRKDEAKCGLEGKYFIQDEHVEWKILHHAIVSRSVYFIPWVILFLAVFVKKI